MLTAKPTPDPFCVTASIRLGHVAIAFIGCLLLAGCGSGRPDTTPVSGKVTLDGAEVADASITFVSADAGGRPAQGQTDAEGKFSLTTFSEQPGGGAIPGEYQVSITKVKYEGGPARPFDPPRPTKTVWLVPEKYSTTSTSGLTASVTADPTEINFDLKSRP